ncbi:unnamed protein product [Echinostoma caproni]|uniref:Uncharacterized protein n=1 Tax=Echinostoma caproni TaxID=27848 RepID=A0A3P8J089_9TREM|nr:unnamed protein product [Echinostoma caproni]
MRLLHGTWTGLYSAAAGTPAVLDQTAVGPLRVFGGGWVERIPAARSLIGWYDRPMVFSGPGPSVLRARHTLSANRILESWLLRSTSLAAAASALLIPRSNPLLASANRRL